MATVYKFKNKYGRTFGTNSEALADEYETDTKQLTEQGDFEGAINIYTLAISYFQGEDNKDGNDNQKKNLIGRSNAYNQIREYDKAIADCNIVIDSYNEKKKNIDQKFCVDSAYLNRGFAYHRKGNKEQAIADWKNAADFNFAIQGFNAEYTALINLRSMGVEYMPQKPSASLSSSIASINSGTVKAASNTKSPAVNRKKIKNNSKIKSKIKFKINVRFILAIVSGIACGLGIALLIDSVYVLISGAVRIPILIFLVLFAIVSIISFIVFRLKKISFIIIMIVLAVPGYLFLAGVIPKNLSETGIVRTVKTATVISDAINFRSEPSLSGSVIRTFSRGDILTITGDTVNGWVPVRHGRDSGYVSAELIRIND